MPIYEPATSQTATATASKRSSQITGSWSSPTRSDKTVVKGDKVTFTGIIADYATGELLAGKTITTTGSLPRVSTVSDANGRISLEFEAPAVVGEYSGYIYFGGDADYLAVGFVLSFIVESRTPVLTLSMPSSATSGSSVAWSGKMTDPKVSTYGIPGKDIYLQESTDGTTFKDVAGPIKTGADGSYSSTYTLPTTPGAYYYRSRYPGGSVGAHHELTTSNVVAVQVSAQGAAPPIPPITEIIPGLPPSITVPSIVPGAPPTEIPIEYVVVGGIIVAVIVGGAILYLTTAR